MEKIERSRLETASIILGDIMGMYDQKDGRRFYDFNSLHLSGFYPKDYIVDVINLAIEKMKEVDMSVFHYQWYKMLEFSLLMSGADGDLMEKLTKEIDKIRYADAGEVASS